MIRAKVFWSTVGGWYVKFMWDDGSYTWRKPSGFGNWRRTYDYALNEVRKHTATKPCYCAQPQFTCLPCQCADFMRDNPVVMKVYRGRGE